MLSKTLEMEGCVLRCSYFMKPKLWNDIHIVHFVASLLLKFKILVQ